MELIRLPDCEVEVIDNQVYVKYKWTVFIFSKELIQEHLAEGWMENETILCESDRFQIELYPYDFRRMLKMLR